MTRYPGVRSCYSRGCGKHLCAAWYFTESMDNIITKDLELHTMFVVSVSRVSGSYLWILPYGSRGTISTTRGGNGLLQQIMVYSEAPV